MRRTRVNGGHLTALFWMAVSVLSVPCAAGELERLDFKKSDLPAGQLTGTAVDGMRWKDVLGENLLIVSQTGAIPSKKKDEEDRRDAELYAYHFIRKGGAWRLLWKVQDFERDCPFDLYAGLLPGSLALTDLDRDGTAETSFLYKLTCRSDVSPSVLKLIMHEGDKKLALRGNTVVPPESNDDNMKPDPAFASAPPEFEVYAVKRWTEFVVEKSFNQF